MSPPPPAKGDRKLARRDLITGTLGPLIAIGVLVAALWSHFDEIAAAWKLISTRAVVALAALHLVALVLRADAWGRCVRAAGAPLESRLLHSSSALRFLADAVVPTYIGAWVRIGLVRRYDAPRAAVPGASPTPTIGQMFTADAVMLLVEAVLTVGLIVVAVLTSPLQWWWVVVVAAVVLLLVLVVNWVFRHYEEREFAKTAHVLHDSTERYRLAAQLAVVLTLQPVRFYIAFKALGLDPSPVDGLLAFLLTTVFNALPIGPGPSSIAASAALFAGDGIDKAALAGIVLLGTAIVAALVYSLYGAWDLIGRSRSVRAAARERPSTPAGSGIPR
jgi:uncharacterized membrane protein YbhN (UPF0104 family)